jgi:uncharacterized Zn-binding protein involved in type VI secretion
VDVADWAKKQDSNHEHVALERLGQLKPSGKPGRVLMPIEVGADSPYDRVIGHKSLHKRIEAAPIKKIPTGSIVTNGQKSVRVDQVAHYIANHGEAGTKHGSVPTDHPIVVRVGGQNVAYDGHHRLTAAILRGDPKIEARFVDLDAKR